MKYLVIAGEPSGDLHARFVLKELLSLSPNEEIYAIGGENIKSVIGEKNILIDNKSLSFMGLVEVVKNLDVIKKTIRFLKNWIVEEKPNAILLIDYPGLNLRIAKFAHSLGIPVYYYIPPKVWAWKQKRVFKIKKYIKQVFCIFPFEIDFYKKFDVPALYFGNPLFESKIDVNTTRDEKIAILPGSRKNEVKKLLPTLIEVIKNLPNRKFVVAGLSLLDCEVYNPLQELGNVEVKINKTSEILKNSKLAIICSGTATLEAALYETPQIVGYKMNSLSYFIGIRLLTGVKYVSLVNIILKRELVKELLQDGFTAKNILAEISKVESDKEYTNIQTGYKEIKNILGDSAPSKKIAHFLKTNVN